MNLKLLKPLKVLGIGVALLSRKHGSNRPFATSDHVAHYYSRTGTLKERDLNQRSLTCLCPSAGIIMSLPSSMADFVPRDR